MKRLLLSLFILATLLLRQDGVPEVWWRIAAPYSFTMAQWEAENLPRKWLARLEEVFRGQPRDPAGLVQGYFSQVGRLNELEGRLERGDESEVREERAALLAQVKTEEGAVEATLEGQLSRILLDLGLSRFSGLGQQILFPPVDFRFDHPPHLLIVSPRSRIELQDSILLRPDLDSKQREAIEDLLEIPYTGAEKSGVSALVEGIGGFATYPTLIPRISLEWTAQTAAHEWLHTYFFFKPLGRSYLASPEMRTVNESAADLAGQEIGDRLLERYYGIRVERRPPEPPREEEPGAFNFNREMHATRLRVDELLAEGKIKEAEAYMRERRDFLAQHGYYIRKLNQAYFAFHGTYAESPASISPIGEQLKELRRRSADVGAFIRTVASLSSYDELLARLR